MSEDSNVPVVVQTSSNGICLIRINRPKVLNALSSKVFHELAVAVKQADESDDVKIIALTGTGKYFTSGNDQNNILNLEGAEQLNFRNFVDALIEAKKPLVALVNGPAIGAGLTILALFDLVLASDSAFFYAPFSKLALAPEACSSYTFPRIMGVSKASELFMFNKRATASEMKEAGIVNQVIPQDEFHILSRLKLEQYAKPSLQTLVRIRSLLRPEELKKKLMEVNHYEQDILNNSFLQSPEAVEIMMKFIQSRQNAKL